jgi:hypothetical protein
LDRQRTLANRSLQRGGVTALRGFVDMQIDIVERVVEQLEQSRELTPYFDALIQDRHALSAIEKPPIVSHSTSVSQQEVLYQTKWQLI